MTCTAKRFSDDNIVKTIVIKKLSFCPFLPRYLQININVKYMHYVYKVNVLRKKRWDYKPCTCSILTLNTALLC